MAPRDPSTIKRDGSGQFAATDSRSLADGLGQVLKQRKSTAKATAKQKAVLKTLATGEDKLGDHFQTTDEILAVVSELEAAGMIQNDGTGYALTEAGIAAIKPKPRKRRG